MSSDPHLDVKLGPIHKTPGERVDLEPGCTYHSDPVVAVKHAEIRFVKSGEWLILLDGKATSTAPTLEAAAKALLEGVKIGDAIAEALAETVGLRIEK